MTQPSSVAMEGNSPDIPRECGTAKKADEANISSNTLLSIVGDYDSSTGPAEGDREEPFIHANHLEHRSFVEAREEDAEKHRPAPLNINKNRSSGRSVCRFTPGPAPTRPLPVVTRNAKFTEHLDETDMHEPTPPTTILGRPRASTIMSPGLSSTTSSPMVKSPQTPMTPLDVDSPGSGRPLLTKKPDLWGAAAYERTPRSNERKPRATEHSYQSLASFYSGLEKVFDAEESDAGSVKSDKTVVQPVGTLSSAATDLPQHYLFPRTEGTQPLNTNGCTKRGRSGTIRTPSRQPRPRTALPADRAAPPVKSCGPRQLSTACDYAAMDGLSPKGQATVKSAQSAVGEESIYSTSPTKGGTYVSANDPSNNKGPNVVSFQGACKNVKLSEFPLPPHDLSVSPAKSLSHGQGTAFAKSEQVHKNVQQSDLCAYSANLPGGASDGPYKGKGRAVATDEYSNGARTTKDDQAVPRPLSVITTLSNLEHGYPTTASLAHGDEFGYPLKRCEGTPVQLGSVHGLGISAPLSARSVHSMPSDHSMAHSSQRGPSVYASTEIFCLGQRPQKHLPTYSFFEDDAEISRQKRGKRVSWLFFALCAMLPFTLLIYGYDYFDSGLISFFHDTAVRPSKFQKRLAIWLAAGEFILWACVIA